MGNPRKEKRATKLFNSADRILRPELVPANLQSALGDVYREDITKRPEFSSWASYQHTVTPALAAILLLLVYLFTPYKQIAFVIAVYSAVVVFTLANRGLKGILVSLSAGIFAGVLPYVASWRFRLSYENSLLDHVWLVLGIGILLLFVDRILGFVFHWILSSAKVSEELREEALYVWSKRFSMNTAQEDVHQSSVMFVGLRHYLARLLFFGLALFLAIFWTKFVWASSTSLLFKFSPLFVVLVGSISLAGLFGRRLFSQFSDAQFSLRQLTSGDFEIKATQFFRKTFTAYLANRVFPPNSGAEDETSETGFIRRPAINGQVIYFLFCFLFLFSLSPYFGYFSGAEVSATLNDQALGEHERLASAYGFKYELIATATGARALYYESVPLAQHVHLLSELPGNFFLAVWRFLLGAVLQIFIPLIAVIAGCAIGGFPLLALAWRDIEGSAGVGGESVPADAEDGIWQAYNEHLLSNEELKDHLFLGIAANEETPIFLHKDILKEHAYIAGDTGTGKTSLGLVPLARGLIERGDSTVVVIDMKGGMDLFQAIRLSAGKRFKYFSLDSKNHSYCFNPLADIQSRPLAPWELVNLVIQALGLNYGKGYGRAYFSQKSVKALRRVLKEHAAESFADMDELLRQPKFKKDSEDASALLDVVEGLSELPHLNPPKNMNEELEAAWKNAIRLDEAVEEKQVIYFHLPALVTGAVGATVAIIAIYTLWQALEDAKREGRGGKEVFVFIDEFQELADEYFDKFLQMVRSAGMGVILSNQSLTSLANQGDVANAIKTNTRFKQYFAFGDEKFRAEISRGSGEVLEILAEVTEEYPEGHPEEEKTHKTTISLGGGEATFETKGKPILRVSPLLPINELSKIGSEMSSSVVQIRGGKGLTQTFGFPFRLKSYFAYSEAEWKTMTNATWPQLPNTIRPIDHAGNEREPLRDRERSEPLSGIAEHLKAGFVPEDLSSVFDGEEIKEILSEKIRGLDSEDRNKLAKTRNKFKPGKVIPD